MNQESIDTIKTVTDELQLLRKLKDLILEHHNSPQIDELEIKICDLREENNDLRRQGWQWKRQAGALLLLLNEALRGRDLFAKLVDEALVDEVVGKYNEMVRKSSANELISETKRLEDALSVEQAKLRREQRDHEATRTKLKEMGKMYNDLLDEKNQQPEVDTSKYRRKK